jgi:pimeloyl-ACP methyl ester carboxylesterase
MLDTKVEVHNGHYELRVCRQGKGTPVILLHGYPDNLQVYTFLMKNLALNYEVIAFDWPGMGFSDEWPGGATPDINAKRLLQLMDEWNIDKAHLVGMDMGTQPALVFAALYPQRIHSVVAMNALIDGTIKTSWEIRLLRRFKLNKLLLLYFPHLVFARALFTFLSEKKNMNKDLQKDLWNAFKNNKVRRFIVRMCAGYNARLGKLPAMYQKIVCPMLILWAEKDKHFPVVQAYSLKQLVPSAKVEIIKNADHWMVLEQAEMIAEKLSDFFMDVNT